MPDWKQPVRDRLRRLNLSPAREADIVEELAGDLEERYRDLLAGAVPAAQAERLVLEELETGDALADRLRHTRQPAAREPMPMGSTRKGNLMESLWHDAKVAFRMMRLRPAFSLAVAGMLAIGVAGNAAIFSIFNGLFLRPLPFASPARLVDLDETAPKWNLERVSISNPDYDAWQKSNKTFDGMAFFSTGNGANLTTGDGGTERIKLAEVTQSLLTVLGLKPLIGRDIRSEEDRPGGDRVILLGYNLWQRLFGGDRAVVGRAIQLSGRHYTVIGVLPREAMLPPDVDAWTPLAADVANGNSFYLSGVGRLRLGVSMEQARADLLRVHRNQPWNSGHVTSPIVGPLRDRYLGDFKIVTRILLGTVAVVLLIACVNIAGLMLVRGESRSREIAIRTAVGASRGRVARQLLTESFAMAAAGGILGVALGKLFLMGLVSLMPDDLPKWVRFDLDTRFVLFCIAVTGLAALLFGLAPVLQAATVDTRNWLQEAARSTLARGKRATLGALVVGEIALALVLLASSGLLLQAFRKVMTQDPGFRPDNVLTFSLRLPPAKYPKNEQTLAFYTSVLDRLRTLPGAASVSAASIVPLDGHTGYFFVAEGGKQFGAADPSPVVLHVTAMPGYLKTMGMTLQAGREFEDRDNLPAAPKVVIVNQTFARHFWGYADVVGKRVRYQGKDNHDWFQVVGVVRDIRHAGLDREVRPQVFVPYSVAPAGLTFAIRGGPGVHGLVGPAREEIHRLDPDLPLYNIRTMSERLARSLWIRRAYSWLFAAFAAVAVLLAAAGVYGVISFAVGQRTREIGIRMALGARPGQVMRGILGQGMLLVASGVAIGLIAFYFAAGLLQSMLFGVSPRDAATYGAVVLGVALVGLAANYIPARRAATIEPMRALRSE
jgi:putative ABC transport system permease protein